MKTIQHNSLPRPILTQTENNTSMWVGHLHNDPTDHFGGQTFVCPAEGLIDNIQVYSDAVQYPGELTLSLHEFDPRSKTWGPAIGNSVFILEKKDSSSWIRFALPAVPVHTGMSYGFRLHTDNALVAIGEAASGTRQPFTFGHEWNADSRNEKGNFFSYFSLAFKVELCA